MTRSISLLSLLLVTVLYGAKAQNCRAILDLARDSLKKGKLSAALEKLQDAENCDYNDQLLNDRQIVQKAIFSSMDQLRVTAEKNLRELKEKTKREEILQRQTKEAYRIAEQARDSLQKVVERLADANANIVKLLLGEAARQRKAFDFADAADKINTARLLGALPDSVDLAYVQLTATIMGHCRDAILKADYLKAEKFAGYFMEYDASVDSLTQAFTEVAFCLALCRYWRLTEISLKNLAFKLGTPELAENLSFSPSLSDAQNLNVVYTVLDRLAPAQLAILKARYLPDLSARVPEGILKGKTADGNPCEAPVKGFLMAPRELTFFEYDLYCASIGRPNIASGKWGRGAQPVIDITWYDAVEYCNWRSAKEDLTEAYIINNEGNPRVTWNQNASGYRLPLSVEWEFAAGNGARQTKYSWGDEAPSGQLGGNVADGTLKAVYPNWEVFADYIDGFEGPAMVGAFAPNDFGLFDMTGNVWEWCFDGFTESVCPSDSSKKSKKEGSEDRMLKGGSWSSLPRDCLVDTRFHAPPTHHNLSIGFRLTRTIKQ